MQQRGVVGGVGAASGAAFVALILAGNMITTGGQEEVHPSGEQVLAELDRAAGSATYGVGVAMELVGFLAFLVFGAYGYRVLRDAEGPGGWLSGVALGGVGLMLAIKVGSLDSLAAAFVNREQLDPELARAAVAAGDAAFVLSWLPFAVFVGAAAASAMLSGLIGRVFGGVGITIGAVTLAVALVRGLDLIDANPLPFLLGLLWTAALSLRWTVRAPAPSKTSERSMSADFSERV